MPETTNDELLDERSANDGDVTESQDASETPAPDPPSLTAPPAKAEEMYTPEVYGHTASGRVTYAAP